MPKYLITIALMLVSGGFVMAQTGFVPQIIRVELPSAQIAPGGTLRCSVRELLGTSPNRLPSRGAPGKSLPVQII